MSKLKVCPMNFDREWKRTNLCIREKCAWWLEEKRWTTAEEQRMCGVNEIIIGGHCVALDWGKR